MSSSGFNAAFLNAAFLKSFGHGGQPDFKPTAIGSHARSKHREPRAEH